jgi:hypothetical protein
MQRQTKVNRTEAPPVAKHKAGTRENKLRQDYHHADALASASPPLLAVDDLLR